MASPRTGHSLHPEECTGWVRTRLRRQRSIYSVLIEFYIEDGPKRTFNLMSLRCGCDPQSCHSSQSQNLMTIIHAYRKRCARHRRSDVPARSKDQHLDHLPTSLNFLIFVSLQSAHLLSRLRNRSQKDSRLDRKSRRLFGPTVLPALPERRLHQQLALF